MSPIDSIDDGSVERMTNEMVPRGGYEWTCPYCEKSRLNKSRDEAGEETAIVALRTHIIASDGAEHGPRNEFPSDEMQDLSRHVVEVDRASGRDCRLDD